jgi:hypothetical protein
MRVKAKRLSSEIPCRLPSFRGCDCAASNRSRRTCRVRRTNRPGEDEAAIDVSNDLRTNFYAATAKVVEELRTSTASFL